MANSGYLTTTINTMPFSVCRGVNIKKISLGKYIWNQDRHDGICVTHRPIRKGDKYELRIKGAGRVMVGLTGNLLSAHDIIDGHLIQKSVGNWFEVRLKNETEKITIECLHKEKIAIYQSNLLKTSAYDIPVLSKDKHYLCVDVLFGELTVELINLVPEKQKSKKKEEILTWHPVCGRNVCIQPTGTSLSLRFSNPLGICAGDRHLKQNEPVFITIIEALGKWNYLQLALSNKMPEELQLDNVNRFYSGDSAWPPAVQPFLKLKAPSEGSKIQIMWTGKTQISYKVNDEMETVLSINDVKDTQKVYLYLEPFRQQIMIESQGKILDDTEYSTVSISCDFPNGPSDYTTLPKVVDGDYIEPIHDPISPTSLKTTTQASLVTTSPTSLKTTTQASLVTTTQASLVTTTQASLKTTTQASLVTTSPSRPIPCLLFGAEHDSIGSELLFGGASGNTHDVVDGRGDPVEHEEAKTMDEQTNGTMPETKPVNNELLGETLQVLSPVAKNIPIQHSLQQTSEESSPNKESPCSSTSLPTCINQFSGSHSPDTVSPPVPNTSGTVINNAKQPVEVDIRPKIRTGISQISQTAQEKKSPTQNKKENNQLQGNIQKVIHKLLDKQEQKPPQTDQEPPQTKQKPPQTDEEKSEVSEKNLLRNEPSKRSVNQSRWNEMIQTNFIFLLENLEPVPLADKLYENQLINNLDHEKITLAPDTNREKKCRILIDKIKRMSHSEEEILKYLKETDQQHIAKQLKQT